MKTSVCAALAALLIQAALAVPASAQQRAVYPGWQNPVDTLQHTVSQSSSCPQLYSDIGRGDTDASSGGQVTALQQFLAGYYHVDSARLVVGVFGPLTQGYVAQFQREQGLTPVGIVGPYTRAEIQKRCTTQASPQILPTPTTPAAPYIPYVQPILPQPSYYNYYYSSAPAAPQPPALYSMSPTQGPVGSLVTITGTNFTYDNTVHFAGGELFHIPSSGYGTAVSFTVPPSAVSRQITPGSYPVYVSNENGQTGSVQFIVSTSTSGVLPGYCTSTYCVN